MIPKIIHQIYIGDINNISANEKECINTCKLLYSDYKYYFWTLDKIKEYNYFDDNRIKFLINNKNILNIDIKDNTYNVLINDVIRFKVLNIFGGMYFDNDFTHIKKLEDYYLDNYDIIACGREKDKILCVGVMGSSINNLLFNDAINLTFDNIEKFNDNLFPYFELVYITGSNLNELCFNNHLRNYKLKIFDFKYFCDKKVNNICYCTHYWNNSWK